MLDFVKNKFQINIKPELLKIQKHTKINKQLQNRYNNIKCSIIKNKNNEIEKFVEN